jgi:hypothetical protein
MNSSSKGALSSGVVFRPCPSFQIQNAGRDAGGFNAVATWREVILNKMDLGLDDGELVMEVSELVVGASVLLDFGSRIPVVKVSNGAMEGVVCGSGAVEESVEPNWHWLGDIGRWVIGRKEEVNSVWIFMVLFPHQQEGSTIISEPDKLGVDEVPLANQDLCGDLTFVGFITVGAAGEEEFTVDLVRILLKPFL